MKTVIYLLIASVVLLSAIAGFTFVTTIIEVYTLGNRVEDGLIAAGWTAFSKVDMDKLAERVYMVDEELRDVSLDKAEAQKIVLEYIQRNLKLDAAYYPREESYIIHRDHPVVVEELIIYNPEELPATCSRGQTFERSTVHIVVSVPVEMKWLGFRYMEKHVDVDIKSFFKD